MLQKQFFLSQNLISPLSGRGFFHHSTIAPGKGQAPEETWFFWEGQPPGGPNELDRRHHFLDRALRDNEYVFPRSLILDDPSPI